ncbi:hypothetical protein C8J57DRAFT_1247714 [Mycena rebaudengoi]|nr:hypothetical protein C8J57DRAFT_1247714 [Mycena rebaudengoi]
MNNSLVPTSLAPSFRGPFFFGFLTSVSLVAATGISDLPLELWTRIMFEALPDGHNRPDAYSFFRGVISCVCMEWYFRIYSNQKFWSNIYVNHHLSLDRLAFALSRCPTADLHIRIVLLDVSVDGMDGLTISDIEDTVRAFMALLAPTSERWSSLYILTENPIAFIEVQTLCLSLPAPMLSSLSLIYSHMLGYSTYDEHDPVYGEPAVPAPWFDNCMPALSHLQTAVPVQWYTPGLFDNLVSLNFADLSYSTSIDWLTFHHLFSTATRLSYLRLSSVEQFDLPIQCTLLSPSLQVLDVDVDDSSFVLCLLQCLDVPSLVELTVRRVNSRLRLLLSCKVLLAGLVRLAIHGDIEMAYLLINLFDSMPSLKVLDLSASRYHVLVSYIHWSYFRFSDGGFPLRVLLTPNTDLRTLHEFYQYHLERHDAMIGRMNLGGLCVDRAAHTWESADYSWLSARVPGFTLSTDTYSPVSLLSGPTAHSLFTFP